MTPRKKSTETKTPERGSGSLPTPTRVPPSRKPETLVVELVGRSFMTFSAFDRVEGREVSLSLNAGEQPVAESLFSVFLDDQFFRDHILKKFVFVKSGNPDQGDEMDVEI